jgi:ornithine cyclodeaminase
MPRDNLLILSGNEVAALLRGREREVLNAVELAYRRHAAGETSVPHSTFLLFPENARNRIIALPAYLGGDGALAGLKWIASFPGNHDRGRDRASAVLILNSVETGIPEAIFEGSIISSKRTAASAALAAKHIVAEPPVCVGLIGCGLINSEVLRFLTVFFRPGSVVLFDTDRDRAVRFGERLQPLLPNAAVTIAEDVTEVLRSASLISIATTASEPHIASLSPCPTGATILHISLRDLSVPAILSADNIVDDVDHVCRAKTSPHLAEVATGNRDFIRGTLGEILSGLKPGRRDRNGAVVFSPFGLGILDLAVGRLVRDLAAASGLGTRIQSFLPEPWADGSTF